MCHGHPGRGRGRLKPRVLTPACCDFGKSILLSPQTCKEPSKPNTPRKHGGFMVFLAWPGRTPPFLEATLQHRHASTLHERTLHRTRGSTCPGRVPIWVIWVGRALPSSSWATRSAFQSRPIHAGLGQAPVPFKGSEGVRKVHTDSLTQPGANHIKSNPAAKHPCCSCGARQTASLHLLRHETSPWRRGTAQVEPSSSPPAPWRPFSPRRGWSLVRPQHRRGTILG